MCIPTAASIGQFFKHVNGVADIFEERYPPGDANGAFVRISSEELVPHSHTQNRSAVKRDAPRGSFLERRESDFTRRRLAIFQNRVLQFEPNSATSMTTAAVASSRSGGGGGGAGRTSASHRQRLHQAANTDKGAAHPRSPLQAARLAAEKETFIRGAVD